MSCHACRLAPCDLGILLGDPCFRMVLLLLHSSSGTGLVIFWVLPLFLLPYHVETIQCYHLLHELAYELAPVTPLFCGFVLCWWFLFALLWWVCLGWCLVLFVVTSSRPSGLLQFTFDGLSSADGHVYALINSCSQFETCN